MPTLTYSVIMSLDGSVADPAGSFAWAVPDAQVHAFANELQRSVGTYLYGRRMYEVMALWDGNQIVAEQPPEVADFARVWRETDKVVYSSSLAQPLTARTFRARGMVFARHAVEAHVVPSSVAVPGPGR